MISFAELDKLMKNDLGDIEPELRELAHLLTDIVNNLDEHLLDLGLPEEEHRATLRIVLKAEKVAAAGRGGRFLDGNARSQSFPARGNKSSIAILHETAARW